MNKKQLFQKLPSVDEILLDENIKSYINKYSRTLVIESIRESTDKVRQKIVKLKEDEIIDVNKEDIILDVLESTKIKYELSLKKVINGTGTILHTNLGRSLLSKSVCDELYSSSSRYSNLEYDILSGERGSRYTHLTDTIKRLTGAEDVLVVNNNAAAVLLALNTLCKDSEVIVSRGELVEVGGSFRIPSIMNLSGAKLVEVGATNKTHLNDYTDAVNENTKAFLKVHTSNYSIQGFTKSVSTEELRNANEDMLIIDDLGSGVFIDLSKYGLSYEPTVFDSIKNGADIITFSGDKLLGGPQAGIIIGKKKYIDKMKKNQLTRALRVDKLTICALEATLRLYLDEKNAIKEIPTLNMITMDIFEVNRKAENLYNRLKKFEDFIDIRINDSLSQIGGGSMPLETIKSKCIEIVPKEISVSKFEEKLRHSSSHIIGRINDNKYILDVRTIFEDEFLDIENEIQKLRA
ncbi:MAG: L-seryl-tRNA(Sec) selenium transferase [Peptostreptococcaceae bacterium]